MNRTELLWEMQNQVEAKTEYYKTDFYNYDIPWVFLMKDALPYIWLVRDSGTHFLDISKESSLKIAEYYNEENADYYFIMKLGDRYSFREIARRDAIDIIEYELGDNAILSKI